MQKSAILVPGVLLLALGCGDRARTGDGIAAVPDNGGTIRALLATDLDEPDVSAVRIDVQQDGVVIASRTLPLQMPTKPGQPAADAFFVLRPGSYIATATPLGPDGSRHSTCAAASSSATVVAGRTVEVMLLMLCRDRGTGGLNVSVGTEHIPIITDLVFDPLKFVQTCRRLTITATAIDKDADVLAFTWTVVSSPPGADFQLLPNANRLSFESRTVGGYTLNVEVKDPRGHSASLTFPVHVTPGVLCNPPLPPGPGRIDPPDVVATRPLDLDPSALPPGARANFPARDARDFFVTLPSRPRAVVTSDNVASEVIAPLLAAFGFKRGQGALRAPAASGVPQPLATLFGLARDIDADFRKYPQLMRPRTQYMLDVLAGRRPPSPVIDAVLELGEGMNFAQFRAGIERQAIHFPFAQVDLTLPQTAVPIEHALVLATRWDQFDVHSVRGTLINDYTIANKVVLPGDRCEDNQIGATAPCQAVIDARRTLLAQPDVKQVDFNPTEGPSLVLLPYGTDANGVVLRYAYRMTFFALWQQQRGQFLLWTDAETGALLKLDPLLNNVVGAAGATYNRDPGVGTTVETGAPTFGTRVDDASAGQYVLRLTGVMNRVIYQTAADPLNLSIASTTGGSSASFANFNQSPINDPAQALCSSGTNKAFQQVNFFGSLVRYYDSALSLGVFTPFPTSPWDPKVQSASAGCNAWSNMDYGACAGYTDAMCPNLPNQHMNFAHDNTIVAHELAHNVTPRFAQARPSDWCCPGMACTCTMPVGFPRFHDLADFWADHWESTNCTAGWVSKNMGGTDNGLNCNPGHAEGGGLPRRHLVTVPFSPAQPEDHYPEHRAGGNTCDYCDMQIAAAALWQVRAGMRSKCRPSGIPQFGVRFARALKDTGFFGALPPTSDVGAYRTLQNLEAELVDQWSTSGTAGGPPAFAHNGAHTTNKVTAGFAKAGLFLVPVACLDGTGDPMGCPGGTDGADAVIDITDNNPMNDTTLNGVAVEVNDFLLAGGPAPTFHVWTGARFRFDVMGNATLTNPSPCNDRFQVEVATDAAFPAASTVTSPVVVVDTNPTTAASPECYGTWTPSVAQWATLQAGGTRIFYRARTQNTAGANDRLSTQPGRALWTVPPPYSVITPDGLSDY